MRTLALRPGHDDQIAQPALLGQRRFGQTDEFAEPAQQCGRRIVGNRLEGLVRPHAGLGRRIVQRLEHGLHPVGRECVAQEIAARRRVATHEKRVQARLVAGRHGQRLPQQRLVLPAAVDHRENAPYLHAALLDQLVPDRRDRHAAASWPHMSTVMPGKPGTGMRRPRLRDPNRSATR